MSKEAQALYNKGFPVIPLEALPMIAAKAGEVEASFIFITLEEDPREIEPGSGTVHKFPVIHFFSYPIEKVDSPEGPAHITIYPSRYLELKGSFFLDVYLNEFREVTSKHDH